MSQTNNLHPPRIAGITGGIGSGKSVVAQLLRVVGYPVYNSDLRAKQLMDSSSSIRHALTTHFGNEAFVEQRLNRVYLANIVFNDTQALAQLNAIVHPAVREDFARWCGEQSTPWIFIESAILCEAGLNQQVDEVWTVVAPMQQRIAAIAQRDKATPTQIEARIESQMSDVDRLKLSTHTLYNDPQHPLVPQVIALLGERNNIY